MTIPRGDELSIAGLAVLDRAGRGWRGVTQNAAPTASNSTRERTLQAMLAHQRDAADSEEPENVRFDTFELVVVHLDALDAPFSSKHLCLRLELQSDQDACNDT